MIEKLSAADKLLDEVSREKLVSDAGYNKSRDSKSPMVEGAVKGALLSSIVDRVLPGRKQRDILATIAGSTSLGAGIGQYSHNQSINAKDAAKRKMKELDKNAFLMEAALGGFMGQLGHGKAVHNGQKSSRLLAAAKGAAIMPVVGMGVDKLMSNNSPENKDKKMSHGEIAAQTGMLFGANAVADSLVGSATGIAAKNSKSDYINTYRQNQLALDAKRAENYKNTTGGIKKAWNSFGADKAEADAIRGSKFFSKNTLGNALKSGGFQAALGAGATYGGLKLWDWYKNRKNANNPNNPNQTQPARPAFMPTR